MALQGEGARIWHCKLHAYNYNSSCYFCIHGCSGEKIPYIEYTEAEIKTW